MAKSNKGLAIGLGGAALLGILLMSGASSAADPAGRPQGDGDGDGDDDHTDDPPPPPPGNGNPPPPVTGPGTDPPGIDYWSESEIRSQEAGNVAATVNAFLDMPYLQWDVYGDGAYIEQAQTTETLCSWLTNVAYWRTWVGPQRVPPDLRGPLYLSSSDGYWITAWKRLNTAVCAALSAAGLDPSKKITTADLDAYVKQTIPSSEYYQYVYDMGYTGNNAGVKSFQIDYNSVTAYAGAGGGDATLHAALNYQSLGLVPDGIIGPKTREAIDGLLDHGISGSLWQQYVYDAKQEGF